MAQKETLLEIKNLVTEFKTDDELVKAVNDISFTLGRGETIGIVGESGSGKSVTSLSVMRLIPNPPGKITGGEIIFHSKEKGATDLLKLSEKEMREIRGNEIAMIFQEPMTSLNPVFTCGSQVMEAIMLHQKVNKQEAKEKTIALFKEVQLPRPEYIFDAYPHQISGGQKQRVMIAMAMSCNPSILIADEPTTALDVTVQKTILDLMLKLQHGTRYGHYVYYARPWCYSRACRQSSGDVQRKNCRARSGNGNFRQSSTPLYQRTFSVSSAIGQTFEMAANCF
jgi:peptide/nickel transport system ATP-binding protein